MILALLKWLGRKRPYSTIRGADGSLYMGRWWLLGGSDRDDDTDIDDEMRRAAWKWKWSRIDAWIGQRVAARLHHIARKDRGRDLHDHPMSFVSVVVAGWYIERLPLHQWQHPRYDSHHYVEVKRTPGSVARRKATDRHTIVDVSPGGAWTVFITAPNTKSWGFHTKDGIVPWREYKGDA